MNKIAGLLRHGFFYTFATAIEAGAPFLLAPFLTRFLSVAEYGIWSMFQVAAAFMRPVIGLSLEDYIRMHYYHLTKDQVFRYLVSIFHAGAIVALMAGVIVIIFAPELSDLLGIRQSWQLTIIGSAYLHSMFYVLLAWLQFEHRPKFFVTVQTIQSVTTLMATIALVYSGWGWQGCVLGKMIGLSTGIASVLFGSRRGMALRESIRHFRAFSAPLLRELFGFGLRYLPFGMVAVIVLLTDRLMLANIAGMEQMSLYAIAQLFSFALLIAANGFIAGWQPWCFRRLKRKEAHDVRDIILGALFYLIALPVGGIILTQISHLLLPWLIGDAFHSAIIYIGLLAAAAVAQGYFLFLRSILHYYQKLGLMGFSGFCIIMLNMLFDYRLIQESGIVGAALATIYAYGTVAALNALFVGYLLYKEYFLQLKKAPACSTEK